MTISLTRNSAQISSFNIGSTTTSTTDTSPAHHFSLCIPSPSHSCSEPALCSGESALDYWRRHSSARMPAELATIAQQCSWQEFLASYMPNSGDCWQLLEIKQDRTGQQHCIFQSGSMMLQAAGSGPIAACSQLLAGQGRSVEITAFHPFRFSQQYCLIMQGTRTKASRWAMAFGSTPEQAACATLSYLSLCLYP